MGLEVNEKWAPVIWALAIGMIMVWKAVTGRVNKRLIAHLTLALLPAAYHVFCVVLAQILSTP